MNPSIWLGWEPREAAAFAVARHSILRRLNTPMPVRGLVLDELIERGLYTRPTEMRMVNGVLMKWDVISEAPMSTEHAVARFLTVHLAKEGWALFLDCDVLARADLFAVFRGLDPTKAVYCVKHKPAVSAALKMDGQVQTTYARKWWSSFMILNASHPSNRALTPEFVNTVPGRDLHAFSWLKDDEIGELPPEWNHLVGISKGMKSPKIAHFTLGVPDMMGFEDQPFGDEWRAERQEWARGGFIRSLDVREASAA